MFFLYSSVLISLFQHEKIKADMLYAEVHASGTAQFADEKLKGLIFLTDEPHVFCMFLYSEYTKVFPHFLRYKFAYLLLLSFLPCIITFVPLN